MAALLELVLTGKIESQAFVSWLCNKLPKDDNHATVLTSLASLQTEFVPYFLGYLREQAAPYIQDLQHTGLTPRKVVLKTKSETRFEQPHVSPDSIRSPPSRTRLCFQNSESLECAPPGIPHDHAAPSTDSRMRRKPRRSPSREAETQSIQSRTWPEPKSQVKMSLGQFITGGDSPAVQKRGWQKPEMCVKDNLLNLNDQEEFPPVGAKPAGKRSQNARRITPTPVRYRKACLPGATPINPVNDNSLGSITAFTKPSSDAVPNNLHLERELLKEEREKRLISRMNVSEDMPPCECFLRTSLSEFDVDIPAVHPSEVKCGYQLNILADIYSRCINANLTPGIVLELHFVIQLLTVRGTCGSDIPFDSDAKQFFFSPSNCVHFAVNLLWLQRRLLRLLDKGTLRLLLENPRLKLFSPELADILEETCNQAQTDVVASIPFPMPPVGAVAFQSDSDNRNNFVCDQEFHTFRRKRDLFYELLREWETSHLTSGWSTTSALGPRIRSLVLGGEAAAWSHLARLFQAQLLAMCKGDVLFEGNDILDGPEPLAALKQSNPEKYKRLQERFVTTYHSAGPCPPPSFPGYQEFFKSFIVVAASHSFNQHLVDGFITKINEINAFQLNLTEGDIDLDAREHFRGCLLALRLLAKFLGFIVFLPYRTSERLPESVLSAHIHARADTRPVLDIATFLRDAIESKRIVLVIPWIVEFLSMMDAAAPFLHYYQQPLKMLYFLYRSESLSIGHSEFSHNQLLILLLLGWLFEVIGFWPTLSSQDLEIFGHTNWSEVDTAFNPMPGNALDIVNVVDQSIVYTCCPHLGELRAVLIEFSKGVKSRTGSVRKIKPISADRNLLEQSSAKKIELLLEENFFHNHPVSMKRMVEFVTDRISSNVIKHVRATIVLAVRNRASSKVSELGDSFEVSDASQQVKMAATKKVLQMSKDMVEEVQTETMAFASDYCPKRAIAAVPVLLPDETLPEVISVCIKIVQRSVMKKVSQWSSTHITTDIFYKDLLNELQKIIKLNDPSKKINGSNGIAQDVDVKLNGTNKHDDGVLAPAEVLISAKDVLKSLYTGADLKASDVNKVVGVMDAIKTVIESREDLTPLAFKMLVPLTVDIAVGVVIRHPGGTLDDTFINFWLLHPTLVTGPLLALLCPRNLQYLLLSEQLEESFAHLESLLRKCVLAGLVSPIAFREKCIITLKNSWPQHFLLKLVECISGIFNRGDDTKFSLVSWLTEMDA